MKIKLQAQVLLSSNSRGFLLCIAKALERMAQNGLTTARTTMPIISTVGTSLIMR